MLSIVTPAYNEAASLPALYARLTAALAGLEWEWIVVDDHSADDTFSRIQAIARNDSKVHGYRLARNCGSHAAIACGLDHARGNAAAVMAADLQDPPEMLPDLLARWKDGAQVVWAARQRAPKTSRVYYLLMRRVPGLDTMPPAGVGLFLIDRAVIEAFRQFREQHTSILALIAWMGFRQATVAGRQEARQHGHSGWTLRKKVALLVDSVTAFTYTPIRLMTYLGFATALLGFLYAGFVIIHAIRGAPMAGWASLMVVVLVIGGIQMLMMVVLGEYLWRALDESRRRPRYLIEDTTERGNTD
ncbi:MAG TPA: glycosyltransferase family 2 protein [Bryobacteraceae bacterium]|nr:glycosyltransferase family 2 protein [Bryobacteraceae bacterium]